MFSGEFKKMHLHWERSQNTAGDCNIRSLSWMGRVPDELPTVRSKIMHFSKDLHVFINLENKEKRFNVIHRYLIIYKSIFISSIIVESCKVYA